MQNVNRVANYEKVGGVSRQCKWTATDQRSDLIVMYMYISERYSRGFLVLTDEIIGMKIAQLAGETYSTRPYWILKIRKCLF